MLRTLGVLAVPACGILVAALGGQVGPVDLTELPPTLFTFAGVTALVLLGLHFVDR